MGKNSSGYGYRYGGKTYANFTLVNFNGETVNIEIDNGTRKYKGLYTSSGYTTVNIN